MVLFEFAHSLIGSDDSSGDGYVYGDGWGDGCCYDINDEGDGRYSDVGDVDNHDGCGGGSDGWGEGC